MMPKTTLVKSITSLSEARYCSGMMVDYISFDLNPDSPDYVPITKFEEIKNWLSGVKILGSFETSDIFQIIDTLNTYSLDGFIFSENQNSMLDDLEVSDKFLEVSKDTEFDENLNINYIIYTGPIENAGIWAKGYNVLLGYEFENVDDQSDYLAGYAFKGSKEFRPGINNYDGLMEALEKLEDRV
jgi:phosphoribosylanthranilate isomerase